ncbi:uncharacterized protein BO80DRAFT_378903 [Aspergillus ibericus CBS 121593]|uniref:Uncharacterized protein n=1 Tax=Aspergillus ibericus CBS 121593 TaxID=1448316 RepID=A0A395H478_9EURO|nr:hypothetical protein BO80DRAFT_378903 [Aspergillus ibericus CBS 121593]RAL02440.1 hypothetical protein BO80DRAFT_378903 [Aspergillus ibericus CBS 121593]
MASLFSDIVQEESQWACITELASQLACVRARGSDSENIAPVSKPYYTCILRDPRLYTLSSHLVGALLHNESRVDDCNIRQILSILKRESNKIAHALDHSSLRCLAYTLLNSEVESGLENGLYLLLDEPQYIRDSGSMLYQVASPQTGDQSRLLQGKLIHKLYHLFSTEEQVIQTRKLAGKLLVEILSESKHNYTFLLESQDADMSGLLSILLYHADASLKAFAAVVFHALYDSGVSKEILWPADGTKDRGTFFRHLVIYEDSPLQLFYTFINEVDSSSATKGQPAKSLRRNLKPRGCFLVQSIEINGSPLLRGIVLTIADEYDLVFMNHRASTSRVCLEYVDVRARDICQPVRTEIDDNKAYRLTWGLSPSKLIFKNGRRQDINGRELSIVSSDDSNELQKTIGMLKRDNRGSSRIDPILRRSSSLMMELDTGEEVTRKSFDFSYTDSQTQAGPSESSPTKQKTGNIMDKAPGSIREELPMSENPEHLKEGEFSHSSALQDHEQVHHVCNSFMLTPNMPQAGLLKDLHGHPLGHIEERGNTKETELKGGIDIAIDACSGNKLHGKQSSKRPRQPNGRFAPREQTDRPQTTKNQLTLNKAKLQLSNTQESMIIYARHSKRTVYTANSKAAVDWDEDLRPSDEEDNSEQNETEVTSISSPLAGGTCIFTKSFNALGKTRVAKRGRRLATKRQNTQLRPRGKTRKQPKRGAAPPADTGKTDVENLNQELEHNPPADGTQGNPGAGTRNNHRDNDMHGEDACSENRCNDAELDSNSAKVIKMGDSLPLHPDGDHNESLLLQATQSEYGNIMELHQEHTDEINSDAQKSSTAKIVVHIQGLHGRGRAVGNRLTAAFQQGDPSPGHCESRKKRLEYPESQNELDCPNESVLSGSIYSLVNQGSVHENVGVAGPANKDYIILDGHSSERTPHGSIMDQLDDLDTEYSTQSPRSGAWSRKSDYKEQEKEVQPDNSAASDILCKSPPEEASLQSYNVNLRDEQDTCNFGQPGRGSEVGENSSTKSEKRKIGIPSPDHIRIGADTGNHDSKTPAEPILNVRKENFYPAKRFKRTPRSTIVDLDGSPRLLPRGRNRYMIDDIRSDGRSQETSDAEEEDPLANQQSEATDGADTGAEGERDQTASCERNALLSEMDVRLSPHVTKKSEHSEDETRMRQIKAKGALTFQDRLMAYADRHVSRGVQPKNAAQTDIDAHFASNKENKPIETCNLVPRPSPSRIRSPALSSSNPMKFSTSADAAAQQTTWQTSLQALHQRAQGMLVATSEHISREIESEKDTINEVLEMYRQDCHRVLDRLFEAQEERIRLCQQQMNSIRNHHTEVCQELVHRLERNEQQLQDRMHSRNAKETK